MELPSDCSVFVLGSFFDPAGSIPEQPGLTQPCCVRDLLRSLQPELPKDPVSNSFFSYNYSMGKESICYPQVTGNTRKWHFYIAPSPTDLLNTLSKQQEQAEFRTGHFPPSGFHLFSSISFSFIWPPLPEPLSITQFHSVSEPCLYLWWRNEYIRCCAIACFR